MNKEFIDNCILLARNCKSKCTPEILALHGMSGDMTRHLYNNICGISDKINYLEIGCFKGSSTLAALYGNECSATVIDNWSEFGGPQQEFFKNIQSIHPIKNIQILNEDSFNLTSELQNTPYDIYLYDGHHSVESHTKAITYYWKYLADTSIIMVDDWDWEMVKKGTLAGISQMGGKILYQVDISEPKGPAGFWNGCGIFLIQK